MRCWFGVALLSGSWLFGLGYFEQTNAFAWFCALVASVLLLADTPVRLPSVGQRLAALALLFSAVWFVPHPYGGAVVLLLAGTAAATIPTPALSIRRAAYGGLTAGVVLLVQAFALSFYQLKTARAHELPDTLAQLLAASARLLGAEATVDSGSLVLRAASGTLRVGATWELLLAPGTVCFVAGGCTLLVMVNLRSGISFKRLAGHLLRFLVLCAAWAPLRAALLVLVVLQQQVRATTTTFPNVGETLISVWVHIALLIGFAIFAGVLIPIRVARQVQHQTKAARPIRPTRPTILRQCGAAAVCGIGVLALTFSYSWVPVGERKGGRVMFVERHSTWEPTTEPYRDKVYGEAGSYNYAAVYEYCSQYYEMSRLLSDESINDEKLEQCDVLIIKTPTSPYDDEEVAAIVRFVQRGGSLLMIGDHTNVFNMSTYLNDISRHFGFTYRNDLLFRIGDPYRQMYYPPATGHPILQYMPPMNFAVSCSIDPGSSRGAMVIRNVGLYNLPPAYHESNYHPQAEYRPHMQYGSWCQLWATTHGEGRIAAFADSTLFSNFCVFQPGKAELFVGMLEWLNHTSRLDPPVMKRLVTWPLSLLGFALLVTSIWLSRGLRGGWLLLIACGVAAWGLGSWGTAQAHQRAMPLPEKSHSMQHVVIDRTVSEVPLFTGAFADDQEGNGYGMLEQWIPRIGNYISRQRDKAAFQGDGLVLICPTQLPSQQYRKELVQWVEDGGQLMVFDSPDLAGSTANSILPLFDLVSSSNTAASDDEDEPVKMIDGPAQTPLSNCCTITGGDPIAMWGEVTAAARKQVGKGTVTVVGFGSLFNDANMGYHWLADPDEELLERYELLYALLRAGLK